MTASSWHNLIYLIWIICYTEVVKTMQPNNRDLDNVKYGKLPRAVGEAKNVSVLKRVYIKVIYFICLYSSITLY